MEILEGTERILIIQTAFLGDAILTLPMIQKLKEIYPDSLIDVISNPQTKEVFINSPFVYEVYSYDKKGEQKSVLSLIKFVGMLKKNNYSRLYSPHRSFRTSILVYFLNVKYSVGFNNASLSFVYEKTVKYNSKIHEVARNLELIGIRMNGENWKVFPEFKKNKADEVKINNLLVNIELPYIVIAPGSVWETKKYPEKYFEKIALYLIAQGYFVIFIGSQNDYDLCNRLADNIKGNSISFAGRLTISESVELLRHAKLLISNDSAPTHMGMVAKIPVLTIYCSTIPEFGFYPYTKSSVSLSLDGLDCKPCGIHGRKSCPIKTFDCGYKLLPESVIGKIEEILASKEK